MLRRPKLGFVLSRRIDLGFVRSIESFENGIIVRVVFFHVDELLWIELRFSVLLGNEIELFVV